MIDPAIPEDPASVAIAALAVNRTVALIDDEGVPYLVHDAREIAADDVVAMLSAGGGIFSVVLSEGRRAELGLPDQAHGEGEGGRRIAASIDARVGITTGISAADRANTARVVADPRTVATDLVVPGHVPPLLAADAGVLARRGAAEAALDLVRLAGGSGVAAICAVLGQDGRTAAPDQVRVLARRRGLPLVTLTEVSARRIAERPLKVEAVQRIVTHYGTFAAVTLTHVMTGESHLALVRGVVEGGEGVPVALYFSSPREDLLAGIVQGGESRLARTLARFARAESGILVHLSNWAHDDPRALDIAAAALLALNPASVRPLDADLGPSLAQRGVEMIRSPARRRSGEDGFDYEVDMVI
jgi:3,4-dihydroxy 2-butanone 4-phosphate synthase / GTP cyclohydrolase II